MQTVERIEYYMIDLREEISDRIKRLRRAAGYSSAVAFAEKIGLTKAKYTHYEQSKTSMPFEIAMRISEGLGVSLDELAYGESRRTVQGDGLVERIGRLDAQGMRELEEALEFIEFKANRRRFEAMAIRTAAEEEVVEFGNDSE